MAETKTKLQNRELLKGVKLDSLFNYTNFILVTILFSILWPRNGQNRCLKCGNQKSYTNVKISGLFHTYMPILIYKSLKLWSVHRLLGKNIKLQLCRLLFIIGGTIYFLEVVIILAPLNYKSIKDNINFRLFCEVIITIEVLTYFRKVFQKVRMD